MENRSKQGVAYSGIIMWQVEVCQKGVAGWSFHMSRPPEKSDTQSKQSSLTLQNLCFSLLTVNWSLFRLWYVCAPIFGPLFFTVFSRQRALLLFYVTDILFPSQPLAFRKCPPDSGQKRRCQLAIFGDEKNHFPPHPLPAFFAHFLWHQGGWEFRVVHTVTNQRGDSFLTINHGFTWKKLQDFLSKSQHNSRVILGSQVLKTGHQQREKILQSLERRAASLCMIAYNEERKNAPPSGGFPKLLGEQIAIYTSENPGKYGAGWKVFFGWYGIVVFCKCLSSKYPDFSLAVSILKIVVWPNYLIT